MFRPEKVMGPTAAKFWLLVVLVFIGLMTVSLFIPAKAHGEEVNPEQVLAATNLMAGTDFVLVSARPSWITSTTVTTTVFSRYIGANGGIFRDSAVAQPDLFFVLKNGWYADLWLSRTDGPVWTTYGDEADFTVGKNGSMGKFNYDVGVTYIAACPLAPANVVEGYLKLHAPAFGLGRATLVPSLTFEHYEPTSGSVPGPGTMVRLGLGHTIPFGKYVALSGIGGVFHDTGSFGNSAGWLAEWKGSLVWTVRPGLALNLPSWKCATPITSLSDSRYGTCVYGLGASVTL